jgi:T5SS/PEP-CTERM-associated repeat protein/autotransporter-associated beta strand protein
LYVGYSGTGSLGITGGAGVLTDGASYLGYAAKSNGLATVSGSASDWQTIGNLAVGYSGAGTLTISGGGDVSDHQSYIGYSAGSDGTVTVTGAGSEWSTTGNLAIGSSGTGTLIVENGGTVAVTGAITVGSAGTLEIGSTISAASATINGGTVITLVPLATAAGATFGTGGVNLNTDGLNSTFTGNFSGTGGLTKSGSGAATFEGASTYTGPTVVNSGTLALTTGATRTASLGNTAISVASGATFAANVAASPFSQVVNAGTTGGGAAGASLTLNPGSTFSMDGPSLATFNLQQQTSFAGPAFTIGGVFGLAPTLIFDIGNAATGTDLLNVTGTVSVLATGGDIAIAALAGDTSLTSGSYNLITTAGGFSGTNGNGLVLSGTTLVLSGTTYDLSLANSTTDDEVLTVSDAPVGPYADLAGQTSSGKTPGPQPLFVPEPGTDSSLLLALGLGAAVWLLRRRDAAKSAKRT